MTDDEWGDSQLQPSLERFLARSAVLPKASVRSELLKGLRGKTGVWDNPENVKIRLRPGNRVIKARLHVLHTNYFTYELLEAISRVGVPDLIITSIYPRNSGSGMCWIH